MISGGSLMGRVEAVADREEREEVSWRLEVGRVGG